MDSQGKFRFGLFALIAIFLVTLTVSLVSYQVHKNALIGEAKSCYQAVLINGEVKGVQMEDLLEVCLGK